jgi:molecular chaperone GrpE
MLAGMGIELIRAVGEPFDPHYHEAVMQQAVEGVAPHTVIAELKKGFMMGEDVIRHAQVAVAAAQAPRDGGAEREQ